MEARSGAEGAREVEVKLALASAADGLARLAGAGFEVIQPRAFEANTVYDTPARALRAAGQLLRLREFAGRATLTWKGPPEPGPHKSREEIETAVEEPSALHDLWLRLGYEPVFRYEKYRAAFRRPGETGVAVLDETPIGSYLELEGPPEWIDRTAGELGFSASDYITESYAGLQAAWCEARGREFTHMIFGTGDSESTK